MSVKTQALADNAIAAFSALVYGLIREQDERLSQPDWAADYGEVIKKKQACELICRSYGFLNKLIQEGRVKVNTDGMVLTRSLQLYAGSPEHKRHSNRRKRRME